MDTEQEKTQKWFFEKIAKDSNPTKFEAGKLYLFRYNPKMKKEMRYYDELPLVLIFRILNDGFIGLNLHYITPERRIQLLAYLFKYKILSNDQIVALNINYTKIKNNSKGIDKPCIHRYLMQRVTSRFVLLEIDEWFTLDRNGKLYNCIITLPIEKFRKKNKEFVWKESEKIIRENK